MLGPEGDSVSFTTWILVGALVPLTAGLIGILVLPSNTIPVWALGTGGALAVYGLAATWAFVAVCVFDRLRRPR
jgi:hypothetical protein